MKYIMITCDHINITNNQPGLDLKHLTCLALLDEMVIQFLFFHYFNI